MSLVSSAPHQIHQSVLSDLAGTGRRALSEFIGRREASVLAVVGGPGSGKTTLLRHTARHTCLRGSHNRAGRDLPILLYLRDHASAITNNPTVSLVALLRTTLGTLGSEEPQGWFEQRLRRGRCLILFDGFDEVARQADRARVAEWVERQVHHYPENDFVISSRPHGYQTAPIQGAEVAKVCGFTVVQVENFIHGWYLAIERRSTGADGVEIEVRARAESEDLLQRLDHSPALHDLTVNPLLLTMIANVHRYRGALPGNRAELYSEICQVMLWRRQDAKKLTSQMSGEKKEVVLRSLAFAMMDERTTDLRRDDIFSAIEPVLRRQSRRVSAEEFVADAVTSGLLIERETEMFAFAHQTFQEFLAATHIRDAGLVEVLANAVNDPWWHETTLLYCARSDADSIIRACLAANNISALALAFDCVDQDSAFDPTLHSELDGLLSSVFDANTEPNRRRLMAGVLLTRHLREQIRAADETRLCLHPITSDIYKIFREETGIPKPDCSATSPSADIAVFGARKSDAQAFLGWANTIAGGLHSYRFPSASALSALTAQQFKSGSRPRQGVHPVWIDDNEKNSPGCQCYGFLKVRETLR